MKIDVRPLEENDTEAIRFAWEKAYELDRVSLIGRYLDQQSKGERLVLAAFTDGEFAGHITVLWQADYPPFAKQEIPLIQDLNVLPKFRRRRIATALVDRAEKQIRKRSKVVGIGVGMYADYGPAQRMYALRGYVPDGRGLSHLNKPVTPGKNVPVDDDLVLYMTKKL